jgi:ubiquinone/menaquinone biosynthesis C-methylase UbiE
MVNNLLIDPKILFQKANLHTGMHVADFGTDRNGHIVFPAAKLLGETGLVYAVDIQKSILESIKKRVREENVHNLHTIWSNLEKGKTAIPSASLDVIFMVNFLSFVQNIESVILEAKRLLGGKARVVIVDWKEKMNSAFGPQDGHLIDFDALRHFALSQGFLLQEEFDIGSHHHGIILYWHK